ncbi:MAG: YdcF family protein [Deltaproteobacteria bacterium]|nr:YdcF family protein [Deltaproteobacteria bacterium]
MFLLKQFIKALLLPPMPWLLLLLAVVIFWQRRWARKLLLLIIFLILALHSGPLNYALRYPLESRYPPLLDPKRAGTYDAIVVLTSGSIAARGLIPFPSIDEAMFRRLDEAWRLYRIQPKPIIVSGGHVDPFTPAKDENKIVREFLIRWGVPKSDVFGEEKSRDTFENALETQKLLNKHGWKRYLLVTSALHMPRSMLVFSSRVPEPIPAPGDFSVGKIELTPFEFSPNESVAPRIFAALHEYIGWVNYYLRLKYASD